MNEPMEQQGVPDEIRELLAQRTTYEDWLRKLDEVGAEYRPDVAERVRSDYRTRLAGVCEELEGHRHELEASLQARRRRMQELTDSFDRQSAELEEAELRHKVGEFDDGTWERKRTDFTEGLEEIELELDGARGVVEELEDVLERLGSSDVTDVLKKNGVPWVGAAETSRGDADSSRGRSAEATGEKAETVARATTSVAEAEKETAHEEVDADEADDEDIDARKTAATKQPAARKDDSESRAPVAGKGDAEAKDDARPARREEDRASAPSAAVGAREEARKRSGGEEDERSDDYLDELEFLESLSLDDPDSFDAVSRMLEDEEDR